ncbi:MAG: helix-turn-helix transcriptional regulator [Clostridia bacterium]|nr:helix-turn-helix transcriptional regulator [Clostridia bacterium]
MKYQRIQDLRKDADLTQQQMAEKLGLWTTTYARYERGEKEIPFEIAIELSKFHNISLDYIAGLINTPKKLKKD